jgi:PAT family beta-lactamase induction signal transducer AmpG
MMRNLNSTSPIAFFLLILPQGLQNGFVTITLPFALTEAGVPVATSAAMLALGLSARVWRFLWAPVADLTLDLRGWYAIGVATTAATSLLISFMPFDEHALLSFVVFLSFVAATLISSPLGGMMAHTIREQKKGQAAGWYEAGSYVGSGIGGGVGVWLCDHYSIQVAGATIAAAMLLCLAVIAFVPPVRGVNGERFAQKMREIGRDFWDMLRRPPMLLAIFLVVSPIGVGAAANIWAAVAPDWHATPDTVALVTGVLSAVVGGVGSVAGGLVADRLGRWWAFFGSGALMALVALIMVATPRTPTVYSLGVLIYALSLGLANAAFTAIVLHAIGRGAATTKFAILGSLGNIPVVYMTAFDGWMHDQWGVVGMLAGEALFAMACIVLGLVAVWMVHSRKVPTPNEAKVLESA